jgi:hypothetical protein
MFSKRRLIMRAFSIMGRKSAASSPVMPPAEVLPGGMFVRVPEESHHEFFQRPGAGGFEIAVA